jgi:hypothetical protein
MNRLLAATAFLSAFLLFQVQPMMGRYILPWFGGTPAVWGVCLLFFQGALLGGYAYAHLLGSLRNARLQTAIHAALLAASLLLLPVVPSAAQWKPDSPESPSPRILLLLTMTVGGPYFLLSATAPLVQRWLHLSRPGSSPWRLYALSNAGSLLALLSYPIVIEPLIRLQTQSYVWAGLYVLFAALCVAGSTGYPPVARPPSASPGQAERRPSMLTILYWVGLSACGSALLLATSNLVTQDIAVAPFLWIAPLSIYLITFILTFESDRWYRRLPCAVLAGVLSSVGIAVSAAMVVIDLWIQLAAYLAVLFVACMLCHGELSLSRPAPRYLTVFYLCVSAGGVLGGAFVAVIAPGAFREFTEYPLALGVACLLGMAGWFRDGAWALWTRGNLAIRAPLMALLFGGLISLLAAVLLSRQGYLEVSRSFYGILRVADHDDGFGRYRQLSHGRIKHGAQFLEGELAARPVSYYGSLSGVAVVMNALEEAPRRIAVVGLGAGSMAAWGRAGDSVTFYEINPDVERIARTWFSYLNGSPAAVRVVLGDARVQLEREAAQGARNDYDLIVVDAFSGDAIPIHLLTAEAGWIYAARLAPRGKILMHISNLSLSLEPVVRALAGRLGLRAAQLLSSGDTSRGEDASRWVLLTADQAFLAQPRVRSYVSGWSARPPLLWTDDFASLWHVLRW